MELLYLSTRDSGIRMRSSEAILKGLSEDGGLFVPERIPPMEASLDELCKLDYRGVAFSIMREFLTDFSDEELRYCIDNAYDEKFDTPEIAPIREAGGAYYLELFHGRTAAFKDMALSILPYLMTVAAKKNKVSNEIVILTATSGDTGKAALAGFADVEGTRIIVFFPKDGVSPVQKLQMVSQKGDNTFVVGVNGNFDDCQSGVKEIFSDEELRKTLNKRGFQFSSANSINIGRLVPQIVYYFYGYTRLVNRGVISPLDEINVVVPTGNFGNILAAYYAKKMGLPIGKLICASNENKVLYDFFHTGSYNRVREFILTSSPSMDILISSNLERLIFHITGEDSEKTALLMKELKEEGHYGITPEMRDRLKDFEAYYTTEPETAEKIRELFESTGYILDTHTAVAGHAYDNYVRDTKDTKPALIASTASPFKFSRSVLSAIDSGKYGALSDFQQIDELSKLGGIGVPAPIEELRNAEVRHNTVSEIGDMREKVLGFLK